jgi:hypothetical protein
MLYDVDYAGFIRVEGSGVNAGRWILPGWLAEF